MDPSSSNHDSFKVPGSDKQLPWPLARELSPFSNSSQGDEGSSSRDEKAAVHPLVNDTQRRNGAMVGSEDVGEDDDWPTSFQRPKEQASETHRGDSTGAHSGGEEAESFLSQPFERLDQLGLLTQFEQDAKETAEFEKELLLRMLELMVEFRVWAESRPTHENEVHSAKLISDLDAIEERELKQENTRLSLVRFLATIQQALNALTQA